MKETLIKFTSWHVSMATKSSQQQQNAWKEEYFKGRRALLMSPGSNKVVTVMNCRGKVELRE